MKKFILLSCIVLLVLGHNGYAQEKGSVLITNGTVITITDGTKENTDVLIEEGIITEIREGIEAPDGVETIDASGKYVMPGIVDAHSHIAAEDVNEWTHPVTAEVSMEESIDPNDINMYWALAGGVTSIHLMHGSANVIGGQNETLKLRYGADMDALRFDGAPRTIKFALGENPTRVHGQNFNVQPRTRMGVEQVIRDHFEEALDYKRNRQQYLEAKEAYESGNRDNPPVPVARNARMEVLVDILEGEIWVHCHSYRADEIMMLMRVFDDYGIENYTFQHANEAYKIAPELRKNNAYTSVFSDWWAYKFEVYYSTAYNASILNENGVKNSINSDSGELIRHLNHEAAKTVHYGETSKEDALKMITINPAEQLGIDDKVGSIEEGKHGDVAIWSGHPLSIYSIAEKTFVDGKKYFDREEDPDDMRVKIDPETDYDEASRRWYEESGRHGDSCLRGAEIRFNENGMEL
ncbi:amidohydrolase family protein [Aliifodinibius salicampi]|uniref:Amidohydrolase family protein n=1 Tax=Fodinibius salicampi TaxID=1920655 RepID=A0ABT3PVE8_9BACT|nr:amidohydrolase family protein [Fodinibius salicampi]MCW9711818.1 amidohydrolase family protein [Fodinibius salicampi]